MQEPEPYPILSLSAGDVWATEEMGARTKDWVRVKDDPQPWLFKSALRKGVLVKGEAWAEKVVAEIALAIELPAARVEFATLGGIVGCVSRQFAELSEPGVELVHGCDLLPGVVTGYDRTKCFQQSDHTLENILEAIQKVIPDKDESEEALRRLAGFVVLDALVLNTDRHHENWGLIRRQLQEGRIQHTVAPSYDHASSLARNEPPERLAKWLEDKAINRVEWYAMRGHGGIYLKGETGGANPVRLAQIAARTWPGYFRTWLERVRDLDFSTVESILSRVPGEIIEEPSRKFALALLRRTQYILSSSL